MRRTVHSLQIQSATIRFKGVSCTLTLAFNMEESGGGDLPEEQYIPSPSLIILPQKQRRISGGLVDEVSESLISSRLRDGCPTLSLIPNDMMGVGMLVWYVWANAR